MKILVVYNYVYRGISGFGHIEWIIAGREPTSYEIETIEESVKETYDFYSVKVVNIIPLAG